MHVGQCGRHGKKRTFLNSAVSSPLDRSKRFTLAFPGRPVHSDTNSASLGSILAMKQLRNDYSPVFCPGFQKGSVQSEKGTLRWAERQKGTISQVN